MRISWTGILILLLATIFAGWRWQLEFVAHQEAENARHQSDGLIDFMLVDLRDKLQPIGRLNILDDVVRKVKDYLNELPKEQVTAPRLEQKARMLDNLGIVQAAQGKLRDALDAYQQS
jgi:hypothetical protein